MMPKYEEDFHAWAMGTANLIRQRRFDELDIDHLSEEIESMGRQERRELTNRLAVLIAHLLKWQHYPDSQTRSWRGTIDEQRFQIRAIIKDNPSLKPMQEEALTNAYTLSFSILRKETLLSLDTLPQHCPYTFSQCLNDNFWPSKNKHPV